jgi:hypothetical protein
MAKERLMGTSINFTHFASNLWRGVEERYLNKKIEFLEVCFNHFKKGVHIGKPF